MGETKGYVSQVIGPVVDIHFDNEKEEKIKISAARRMIYKYEDETLREE